jgi:hypothetical protein
LSFNAPPPRVAGPPARAVRAALTLLAILAVATACAAPRAIPAPALPAAGGGVPGFVAGRDTLAFANEIRARNPGVPDLYANYCFVLARAVRQFFVAARFDPAAPRLGPGDYAERVGRIRAVEPWSEPWPEAERIVIPGYASLRDFSAGQEAAVKEGLGGRFWTLVHWTNWRIAFPVTGGHQEAVAGEIVEELARGRLVQLLVTNWPIPELNHTVVAFAWQSTAQGIDLTVWDPNDPSGAGVIGFDREARRFRASRLHDTRPGTIRVFRMYYSRWL